MLNILCLAREFKVSPQKCLMFYRKRKDRNFDQDIFLVLYNITLNWILTQAHRTRKMYMFFIVSQSHLCFCTHVFEWYKLTFFTYSSVCLHFSLLSQHRWYGEGPKPEETHWAVQRGGERAEGGQAGDGQTGSGAGRRHRCSVSKDKGESLMGHRAGLTVSTSFIWILSL